MRHIGRPILYLTVSFNLFNWYTEGFEDADTVRRNNSHPWIKNNSDENNVLESRYSVNTVNKDNIKRWQDGIDQ